MLVLFFLFYKKIKQNEEKRSGRKDTSIIFHGVNFIFSFFVPSSTSCCVCVCVSVCTCRPFRLRSFDLMWYDLFRRAIQAKIILQPFHFQLTQIVHLLRLQSTQPTQRVKEREGDFIKEPTTMMAGWLARLAWLTLPFYIESTHIF